MQDSRFDLHVSLNHADEMLTKGGRPHPRVIYLNVTWRSAACICLSLVDSKDTSAFFFLPPALLSFHCHFPNTMDNSHQWAICRALKTAASHQDKLKKTISLSGLHFLGFHIFRLNTVWKRGFVFFFCFVFFKTFYHFLLQRCVFIYI